MRALKYLSIIFLFTACSIYQSDGRKFLEKSAYSYAGVKAVAHLQDCAYTNPEGEWLLVSETAEVKVYSSEEREFALRVEAETFGCIFNFSSAQEMVELTDAAVDLTVLHLSLGEFAFHPLSRIK